MFRNRSSIPPLFLHICSFPVSKMSNGAAILKTLDSELKLFYVLVRGRWPVIELRTFH
jgi:nitrate reductase NapE component